jgi:hypothetical protein
MALPPIDFALSYIRRSGRVDLDRLARIAPRFVARVRPSVRARGMSAPRDTCPDDAPGAREVGFDIPPRFNAASVLFDNLTNGNADRPAIHHDSGTLSYAALCRAASRFGYGLLASA